MADDVRIVIDCDASKVVIESAKGKRAIRDLGDATRKAAADAKMYQDASGRWREENGRFVSSARKAELGLDKLSTSGSNWKRVQDAGAAAGRRQVQTLHELGTGARRLTLALGVLAGAGITHLIRTGADFEQQMSKVKATLEANGAEMVTLTKLAQKMGADTKFSASEAASAMYELASAGFKAREMAGALEGTLALAASSDMDLAAATEITANALRGFNLESKESTHVADVLAKAVASSSLELTDMQDSLKYVGAISTDTGQSLESVTAALSIMADAGIKGEQGGTSLRGGLIRLVKPTKQVQEGLRALGITAEDLQGPNGLKPLAEIVELLTERSDGLTKAQRNTAVAQIFGTEAFSGMAKVLGAGAPKIERLTREYERSDGAAVRMSRTMQDNVKGAFEQLTGSIETVETALFAKFQRPLKEALLDATSEVNTKGKQVEEFFDRVFEMPEFQAADVAGKLQILLDEFDKTGLPDRMRDMLVEGFANGLNAALPIVIDGAANLAVAGAKAFGKAFIEADPLSRVLLTGYLLHKTGALAAFRAYGRGAGAAVATGAAAGTASAAAAGGWKNSAKSMGKQFGVAAAVAAAAAYGPEFAKQVGRGLSGEGELGLPKARKLDLSSQNAMFGKGPEKVLNAAAWLTPLKMLEDSGNQVIELFGGGKDKLREFGEQAEATFGKLKAAGNSRALSELADQTREMARRFPEAAKELNAFAATVDRTAGSAGDQFALMREAGGKNMRAIKHAIADTSFEITQRFGPDTARAKDALSRNFLLAAQAIRKSMRDGKISTQTGMKEIEALFVKALANYGFTAKQAKNMANGQSYTGGPEEGGASAVIARARGGLATVGQPGAAGRDTVPAILNGQPSMIAEGEQVAVFNRHQQAAMNARLADQGGLAGFFARNQRPHYMASGGIVPGYAAGGIVPIPGMPGESIHRSILPDVLRIIRQYHARVTDGYATSGHAASGEHPKGLAVDLVPGKGGSWEQITALANWAEPTQGNPRKPFRWVGYTGDPNHGPGNHLHLSWLAGAGLGGSIGTAATLKRVLMERGDLGAVTAIGQRALDIARAAAQGRLDSLAGSTGSGGEGAELGSAAAEAGGDGAALMREISERYGWNFADWWEIDRRETGHGSNLVNPTSTARLRGQFLDMNYGKYGPGSDPRQNPSMAQQIESMGRYIRERYGNPTKALAHHDAHNWYAAGGIVPGAKGKGTGGKTATPAPARAGKFKPMRYRGKVLDAVPQLGQIASLDEQLERASRRYDEMDRTFNLTDEDALSADAAGNETRNEPDIARRVSEIDQLIGQKGASAKLLEDQRTAATIAARKVAEAIAEREERIADVLDAAKRNKRRIDDAQDDLNDERRGRGWQGKVSANERRIDSLQDDLRAETAKKGGSRTVTLGLRNQIDELQDENRRLRKTKPKGGDAARVKRLVGRLDRLRDEREELVGTRSVAKDAQADGGMLGSATKGLASYREAQGGADGRGGLVDLLRRTLPDGITDIGLDVAELRKEREKWTGTVAPAANLPTAGADSGLADLLRQQLDAERARSRMLGEQFGVFAQFAPLVGLRMQGSFARGLDEVRQTGLAVIHKGESIGADPKGPFASQLTAGVAPAPVQVSLTFADNTGQLVRLVDARVNGQAARVVSEQLGRRSRLIASAPGGHR
jgi:TP901 family phage tail tape measure protein